MERKGITRILTGMLFLSPLISDAWRYGTYIKEFRGNWPKNTDYTGKIEVTFADGKVPEDVLEGVASAELDHEGFKAINPDTYDKDKEYWKVKDISDKVLKPFDDTEMAKGPTYECMKNPMVCISKDKDPKECVKKVHFYDLTEIDSYSPFQTIKFDEGGIANFSDDQFYALLAPTLYCSMDYSKIIPVDDGKPEAFYGEGEFEGTKTKRETQCFNVRGNAQLFIDFGTKGETWKEAGDAPIQVHHAMIVYQMPKDPEDGKKWWLHTGPAIFGPELETLKPNLGGKIDRQYTATIEQMNGVEILTAEKKTALTTSAVALGLGNDRVGFLSDCCSTISGGDNSTTYDYHNIEITSDRGGTVRTRVVVTEEGHQIAFDTLHVILPHATGLVLQNEMFMKGDRLALNDPEKELEEIVNVLGDIKKRADEKKDISIPEKFGFAIDCVKKFQKNGKISFDEVPGGGGGEGGEIWDKATLNTKYAALKKECDEFLKNLTDSAFKTAALAVAWDSIYETEGDNADNFKIKKINFLEDLLKAEKAKDAKTLYEGDFQKHFDLYYACSQAMCDVDQIMKGLLPAGPVIPDVKSGQQINLETVQAKLQELRKLLGIAGDDEEEKHEDTEEHHDGEDKHTPPSETDFPGKIDVGKDQELQDINSQLLLLFKSNAELKAAAGKINWTEADLDKKINALTGDGITDEIKEQLQVYANILQKIAQVKGATLPEAKIVYKTDLSRCLTTFIVANYKFETVFGSKKDWRPEEIPMGMQKIFGALILIESADETNKYNAFAKVARAIEAGNFVKLIDEQTENLQKQLKAYTATYHCISKIKENYEKNRLEEALFDLGAAQVCWNRLNMFLDGKEPNIAVLDGEAKASQDNYKATAAEHNNALQDIINQAQALTGELDRSKFNVALYNCWNQYIAYTAMIDAMTPTNVVGLNGIGKAIEYYGKDLKDKYLVELQNAFNDLKAVHDVLIAQLATEITNLQNEVNDKLGDIHGLVGNWDNPEKDILSALKDDVGNQLKAKLYKLYHDAITAADAAKDTNVAEAQKKLEEAKQYYGAIQALTKDVKNGGCDFTKLTGAWEKSWKQDEVEVGIKSLLAALKVFTKTIPAFEKFLPALGLDSLASGKPMSGDNIEKLLTQLSALKGTERALAEALITAFERLISALMTKDEKEVVGKPDEKRKKMQIKLGVAQAAFQLALNGGTNPNELPEDLKQLQDTLQKFYEDLEKKTKGLEQAMEELSKDGMIPEDKQQDLETLKKTIRTNKMSLLTLQVLERAMSEKNSGNGKVCGIVVSDEEYKKQFQGNTENAEKVVQQLQEASEKTKKEKLQKDIEAAKKEVGDFATYLKDYEVFAKAFNAINWDGDDVAERITAQAGGNDELKKQLELYQQYLAALKSAEDKKDDDSDEAQNALEEAKTCLENLKHQLAASYFPKGNPKGDWTDNQPADYKNLIKWYQWKVEWISAIEEKAREVWGDSPIEAYKTNLAKAKEDLQKYRKGIVELSKATQAEFGGKFSEGKYEETDTLRSTAWYSIEALELTIPLSEQQDNEKKGFQGKCENLKKQMQALKEQVSKWYNEDKTKRSEGIASESEFNNNISLISKCLSNMNGFNYEYERDGGVHPKLEWRSQTISLNKYFDNAKTALNDAQKAFEVAKKAAGASQGIQDQYNECNDLYTELMTKQSELASKIAKIDIDESWSDKDEVKTKQEEAKKALDEYNTKLAGLQTALTAALGDMLSDTEKKAALTKVKKGLEDAQKELNENINKTISEVESAVTEAQKKAQEAAKIAQIPHELAAKNKEIGQKVEKGVGKLNSASWTQFGKVDKAVRKLVDIIFKNPSKSLNELIQEEDSKIVSAYKAMCEEYAKLQELSPAVSSSQSHSGSHQQSSQTGSNSEMHQTSVSAPTSPSRRKGKVSPGRYTFRESQAVLSGKRRSIHEASTKRSSRRRQA